MATDEKNTATESKGIGRRQVMTAGAAVIGAASFVPLVSNAAEAPADPAAPKGLAPLAMLDQRFPVTYQDSIPNAVRVMTDFFAALSRRDLKGMAGCLHFPFASYEDVDPIVVSTQADFFARQPASMSVAPNPERATDHEGYIGKGSYDVFAGLEILTCDPVNVCMSLTYYRYGADGKKTLRSQGIYAVTNNDGRWAIQLASVMMTPADMMDVAYPDTVEVAKRLRLNHDLTYNTFNDGYDQATAQLGTTASVTNNVVQVFYQKIGNMDPYRVKGVKTRLSVREVTTGAFRKRSEADFESYRKQFTHLGAGKFGFVYGTLPDMRVLHASVDKAHVLSGVIRFNTSGEEINCNQQLFVVTYKPDRWGIAGSFAYTCPHDRANDMLRKA